MFVEKRDFIVKRHRHSTPPFGGPRRNIAISCHSSLVGYGKKLEWCMWLHDSEKQFDEM